MPKYLDEMREFLLTVRTEPVVFKALKSPLARRMVAAGVRIVPGVPVHFEGEWYLPTAVPKAK